MVKNPPALQETWLRSLVGEDPLEKEWQPTPDSCLETPMDRGAGWVTVHGVTKSQTQLNDLHTHKVKRSQKGGALIQYDCSL